MPTRRMIDPSFWTSETVGALTRDQRLLFIGLWSNADDQGRIRGHVALVRSCIFPYDDISLDEIRADLAALSEGAFILCYQVEGREVIQIKNWWTYQRPQWAYPSDLPAPEGWEDKLRYRQDNQVITDNWFPPKSLPKALANGSAEALDCGHSISSSSSNSISNRDREEEAVGAARDPSPLRVWREVTDAGLTDGDELRIMAQVHDCERWRRNIEAYMARYPSAQMIRVVQQVLDWYKYDKANGERAPPGGNDRWADYVER